MNSHSAAYCRSCNVGAPFYEQMPLESCQRKENYTTTLWLPPSRVFNRKSLGNVENIYILLHSTCTSACTFNQHLIFRIQNRSKGKIPTVWPKINIYF